MTSCQSSILKVGFSVGVTFVRGQPLWGRFCFGSILRGCSWDWLCVRVSRFKESILVGVSFRGSVTIGGQCWGASSVVGQF